MLLYGENSKAKYKTYTEHPLYKKLHALHLKNIKEINYEIEHPDGFTTEGKEAKSETEKIIVESKIETPTEESKNLDEAELLNKRKKSIDDTFAEYLNFISRKVNKKYYQKLISFVFLFRECVEEMGDRLAEERKQLPPELFPPIEISKDKGENPSNSLIKLDYCQTNNAEQVPDASNEFIMTYISKNGLDSMIDHSEAIDLTQNLCHWLFINGYTCSKLSLID